MTIYKTVEVQIDLSDFETDVLLEELMARANSEAAPNVRSWLLEMLSPDLEPLLVDLYEGLRGARTTQTQDKMLAKLFDITLGRIL